MRRPSILPVLVCLLVRRATSLIFSQTCGQHDRRAFLSTKLDLFLASTITVNPLIACAIDPEMVGSNSRGGRPFAPPQALLPAARLKLWVDEVYSLTMELNSAEDPSTQFEAVQSLNKKLASPPKLFRGETMEKRTSSPTAQLSTSISNANKDQYQLNRKGLNLGDKLTAMMNQADVERQWGMLQYAESKREEGNEMRAAFNFYSRQLTFADEYVLTASPEERKKMIRKDELPTLTAVIASDLDRRDLFRNQFLTAIDDAIAESSYQAKLKIDEVGVKDLISLVNEAQAACNEWFSLIPSQDVEIAFKQVT
ncbi:hypothetical protein ACHAWF_007540 [Thalassiosira exigua]